MPRTDLDVQTLVGDPPGDGQPSADVATLGPGADASVPAPAGTARALRRGDALGRYLVVDTLGRGGMGVVYAAYDPELDRRVAIKVLAPARAARAGVARTRLVREAQALAKLSHRNVVAVHDVGEVDDAVFVAMEYIEGQTVAAWQRALPKTPGRWRDVLAVFLDAGRGLQAAHAAGMLHRDFKPDNIMRAADGRVVVLDFGLARSLSPWEPDATSSAQASRPADPSVGTGDRTAALTVTGRLLGTPAFMAPEQFAGAPLDARTDQFSFCVSLYLGLYLQPPFAGETFAELAHAVLQGEIAATPSDAMVPRWLRRVLLRGLSRAPQDRYPSIDALLAALDRDPVRRRRRLGLGVAAVALGVAGVFGGRAASPSADPCAAVDAALDAAWGGPARAAAQAAFARDAKTYSQDTWLRVSAALDDYARQWQPLRRAACAASQSLVTEAATRAADEARCLDASLRRVKAITTLFSDADQALVAHAVTLVGQVAPPGECGGPTRRAPDPTPDDPDLARAVEKVRVEIERARALVVAGQLESALVSANTAVEQASALGYGPVQTEALVVLAGALRTGSDLEAASLRLHEAAMRTLAEGRDRLRVGVLADNALHNARRGRRFDLAQWQLDEAVALVRRLGADPVSLARVELRRAEVLLSQGGDQARVSGLQAARGALAAFRAQGETQAAQDALLAIGGLLLQGGNYAEAGAVLADVLGSVRLTHGPSHPQVGVVLGRLAQVYADDGQHERAVAVLLEALEIFQGAMGASHPNTMAMHNGLGIELERVGRYDAAMDHAGQALAIAREIYREPHAQLDTVRINDATLLRQAGRIDEALVLAEQTVADTTKREGLTSEAAQYARGLLALTLRTAGRLDAARAIDEAIIAERTADGHTDADALSDPLARLALTLHAQGQTDAARMHAQRAFDLVPADAGIGDHTLPRFVLAYLLRAGGDAAGAEALADPLAIAFDANRDHGRFAASFRAWQAGQDVAPNY